MSTASGSSAGHRIFTMSLASVYPLYLAKIERKGRTKAELDAAICWLTGYDERELDRRVAAGAEVRVCQDGLPVDAVPLAVVRADGTLDLQPGMGRRATPGTLIALVG